MMSCTYCKRHNGCVRWPTSATHGLDLNVDDLVSGRGAWENMQEVIRSTIKALLDTQAEHHRRLSAQEKQVRDTQALLVGPRRLAADKARREEAARATASAAETAAGLSKLRDDVSAAKEDAKAEANDLLARVESKASKQDMKACLDGKADLGELAGLRDRLDRLTKGAVFATEPMDVVVQALRQQASESEKRLADMEARVQGCEAHAVRADPAAVALRIETVSSELRDLKIRVGRKASASETERALEQKADKSMFLKALKSKADRAHLSAIEESAASLLDVSRERAAAAAALERKAAAAAAAAVEAASHAAAAPAAAAASLRPRFDSYDEALARLSTECASASNSAAAARVAAAATAEEAGRAKGGRCCCERELRRALRRLERVEGGLAAVATASAGAGARATRAADALERGRKRDRQQAEADAVADMLRALALRMQAWDPARHLEAVRELVESRVTTAAKESTADATAALSERLSAFERQVQGILSEFSHKQSSQDVAAAGAATAAAAAATAAAAIAAPAPAPAGAARTPPPAHRRQAARKWRTKCGDNRAAEGATTSPRASAESRAANAGTAAAIDPVAVAPARSVTTQVEGGSPGEAAEMAQLHLERRTHLPRAQGGRTRGGGGGGRGERLKGDGGEARRIPRRSQGSAEIGEGRGGESGGGRGGHGRRDIPPAGEETVTASGRAGQTPCGGVGQEEETRGDGTQGRAGCVLAPPPSPPVSSSDAVDTGSIRRRHVSSSSSSPFSFPFSSSAANPADFPSAVPAQVGTAAEGVSGGDRGERLPAREGRPLSTSISPLASPLASPRGKTRREAGDGSTRDGGDSGSSRKGDDGGSSRKGGGGSGRPAERVRRLEPAPEASGVPCPPDPLRRGQERNYSVVAERETDEGAEEMVCGLAGLGGSASGSVTGRSVWTGISHGYIRGAGGKARRLEELRRQKAAFREAVSRIASPVHVKCALPGEVQQRRSAGIE